MTAVALTVAFVSVGLAVYAVFRRGSRWPDGHTDRSYWQGGRELKY